MIKSGDFMNKVVLITGARTGIGRACAIKFAKMGYDIILNYHTSNVVELKKELETYKVKVLDIKCDLKNEEEIKNMVNHGITEFNHIDVLINNAAIEYNSDFFDKDKAKFMETLEVNLVAPFLISKYVSKYMIKNKYGKIVNISSNNAINKNDPTTLEYDASKAGLISLTHNLALELKPFVNVNAVAPGWVMTEKVKKINDSLDGMLEKEEKKKILLNKIADPSDIANVVYFLSSDEANYINNQVIIVDGGVI